MTTVSTFKVNLLELMHPFFDFERKVFVRQRASAKTFSLTTFVIMTLAIARKFLLLIVSN